jgi:hypothetical protein
MAGYNGSFGEGRVHIIRQGKHTVMSDGSRIVTIPGHNPVNAFTMGGIARDAGLSVEEFKKLL